MKARSRKPAKKRVEPDSGIEKVLGLCVERAVPARVVFETLELSLQCRFLASSRQGVEFEVFCDERLVLAVPAAGERCCVSFNCLDRPYLFMSTFKSFRAGEGLKLPRFVLHAPRQLVVAERRAQVRVPVTDGTPLKVLASDSSGASIAPLALDIGPTGMLLQVLPGDDPQWKAGSLIDLSLELSDHRALLKAVVRHGASGRYGIAFELEAAKPKLLQPLQAIVADVERRFVEHLAQE